MKPILRTAIVLAIVLFYTACQKEVADIIPNPGPQPTDSTGIGTDTTITAVPDSLYIISFSPDSGRVGTEVRIVGSGFDTVANQNIVLVNATPASVVSATKTVLTIKVSAGSTTGKISVAANGKAATSLTNFIVVKDSVVRDSTSNGKNVWTRKADSPWESTFINGFSINGKGYLFEGIGLIQYDPATNGWTQKAQLPSTTGATFGFCFVIGSQAYVGLGARYGGENIIDTPNNTRNYKEVWAYDAAQDTWTRKKDFPGAARVVPFSFAVAGTGYVGGGDTTNANLGSKNDFWKYDPAADSWTRLRDFPNAEPLGFSGFSVGGSGYVFEGGPGNPTDPTGGPYSPTLWKYNAAADTWEKKAPLPITNFLSAAAFAIGAKGYVALGTYDFSTPNPSPKADFWQYDPIADKWTQKADVGGGVRWLGTGFAVGGKGYVGLGIGGTFDDLKSDFWEYKPE